jgi:hypothetical protein
MSGIEYRLFVDDQPAGRDIVRAIDELSINQIVAAPWEAQLVIPVCLDEQGRWDAEADRFVDQRTRFRVEVHTGGRWIPLIDGPTASVDVDLSGNPNESSITVHVTDDTAELVRDRGARVFNTDWTVEDVARDLLSHRAHITVPLEIAVPAETPSAGHAPLGHAKQPGVSCYDYLTELASARGLYVFVLPHTTEPGLSLATFGPLPDPAPAGKRPATLILAGPERNVETLSLSTQDDRPGRVTVRYLDLRERTVQTTSRSMRDRALLGEESSSDEELEALLEDGAAARVGPDTAAAAALERSGYVIRGTGSVEGRCYPSVLRAYDHVDVRGVSTRLTGTYLVHSTTHTLSRAGYRQDFALWRNAFASSGAAAPPAVRA